ncbi:DUF2784 domain-containing protein [Thermobifida halotolerans]|uniref:DUF2784 domain-containing protein n=1 Tax=Thermobifida halotolerans TaxID=483545 RepID=A0A399G1K6_9ACTN|nr:DUF2784 domain-containing protein [Thermobifida halotolerans]UOE20293.1 DUF2784 domain-containing protein [Thermobifida halotolerans]
MGYLIVAEAAMALHFAFLAYVVCGGFLVWRWPQAIWPHLAAAAYGLGVTVVGWLCPLTWLEHWGRVNAGQEGLGTEGFISHYLTGVVYPAEHLRETQLAAAAVVALSWIGAALLARRRAHRTRESSPAMR